MKTCLNCGKVLNGIKRKFCSSNCKTKYYVKNNIKEAGNLAKFRSLKNSRIKWLNSRIGYLKKEIKQYEIQIEKTKNKIEQVENMIKDVTQLSGKDET